jgi:hypothetical protein
LTTKAELSKGEGVGGRLVDCRYDLEVLLRASDIQFSIVRAKNSVLDSWARGWWVAAAVTVANALAITID